MHDDSYFQGSDSYVGKCPVCGGLSYTTYNELCDKCLDENPVKCPKCFTFVMPYDYNFAHGMCNECVEYMAEQSYQKIISKLNNQSNT